MLWTFRRAALRRPSLWVVLLALSLTSQSFSGTYAWCLVSDSSVHVASAFGPCPGHGAHGDVPGASHHDERDTSAAGAAAAGSPATGHCDGEGAGHRHGLHVAASDLVAGSVQHAAPPPSQRFVPVLLPDSALRPDAAAAIALFAARRASADLPPRRLAEASPGADSRLLI
jgi:hypothetical protein